MRDGFKIFRDPIYDLIYFNKEEDAPILEIIDTPEFQRLRRIKQLGLSSYTYTSSTHDRFSHSIGVCFLAGRLVENLSFSSVVIKESDKLSFTLDKNQVKLLVRLAAILHDIGHGPFSHAFERAIKSKVEKNLSGSIQIHEDYSIKIINSENIKAIFGRITDHTIREMGIKWVCDILGQTFDGPKWIQEIISSQFDADRIDYLLRDAYMCGVKYATFDWDWIFRNMFIGDIPGNGQGILIDGSKGTHSLESFVISRYHMYEQVYFHKTTRGFEAIVNSIFKRIGFLIDNNILNSTDFLGPYFLNFLKNYESIDDYLQLDDYYMVSHFHHWAKNSSDKVLKKLCSCFVNRRPFKMIKYYTNRDDDQVANLKHYAELSREFHQRIGSDYDYFFLLDDYKDNPYTDTYLLSKTGASKRIWLSSHDKPPKDLAEESVVINALRNKIFAVARIYVDRDYLT